MADVTGRLPVKLVDPTTDANEAGVDASGNLTVAINAASVDLALGSDISNVFGASTLITTTQADNLADSLDGLQTTTFNYVYDGANWDRMLGDSTDGTLVNLGANNDVALTAAGGLTALELIDNTVFVAGTATYTEATSSGNLILAVRNDSLDALANADNEMAPLQVDASGSLYVTGGGGGTEYTEDAPAPADPVGSTIMIKRDDIIASSPVTGADDFMGMLGTEEGALWVQDFNSDALLVDTGTIASDTTNILADTAAMDTNLATIAGVVSVDDTDTHSTGSTTGFNMMAAATPSDAAVASNDIGMVAMSVDRRLHVDADITASVALDVSASTVTVAGTGTFVVQEDGAALTALQLIDDAIFVDDTATHSTGSTKIMGIGAVAVPSDAAISANDIGMVSMSLDRRLLVDADISPPANPVAIDATNSAQAAGAEFDFDTADLGTGTFRLTGIDFGSTVTMKAIIMSVDNNVETIIGYAFSRPYEITQWRPPHRDYYSIGFTNASTEVFRVSTFNLDANKAADTYCTIYYEDG